MHTCKDVLVQLHVCTLCVSLRACFLLVPCGVCLHVKVSLPIPKGLFAYFWRGKEIRKTCLPFLSSFPSRVHFPNGWVGRRWGSENEWQKRWRLFCTVKLKTAFPVDKGRTWKTRGRKAQIPPAPSKFQKEPFLQRDFQF